MENPLESSALHIISNIVLNWVVHLLLIHNTVIILSFDGLGRNNVNNYFANVENLIMGGLTNTLL
jgi:hypothetical protein